MSVAIILAAGSGRRMQKMGWQKPKCLLRIAGKSLLDRALEALNQCGVRKRVIVAGYQHEVLRESCRGASVGFVLNPQYASTNTLHSLWLARSHFDDPTIILNADLVFDVRILERLLALERDAIAVAQHPCGPEEVKVVCDHGRVTRIGKDVPVDCAAGESIGLAALHAPAAGALADFLDRRQKTPGGSQLYYETALNDLLARHFVLDAPIGDLPAIEIDTPEDYQLAQSLWPQ